MLKRVKQVYMALTAEMTKEDKSFAARWLNGVESELLWAMNLPDQRHVLNVAYTALRLNQTGRRGAAESLLVRCCLLHDVGKVRGDVSTFDKVMAVVLYRLMPIYAEKQARRGRGDRLQNLRHALYIYKHHARIGHEKLMAIGAADVAVIIVHHHEAKAADEPEELSLLREADELN